MALRVFDFLLLFLMLQQPKESSQVFPKIRYKLGITLFDQTLF